MNIFAKLFGLNIPNDQPKRPIHDINEYPAFKELASNYAVIVNELKKNSYWMHWGSDNYDPSGHCEFLKGEWTVCPVYFGNYDPFMMKLPNMDLNTITDIVVSLPERFPETTKMLKEIKELNYAAFSRLHSKSKLAPHTHNNHYSLIFHLGLLIPPGNTCGLKVDDKIHLWTKPGDAIIFDDTYEHSAWNDSDQERIILYIDFAK